MSPLERRYRRLLAVYPAGHRRAYAEEMLAVLLDSAAPDQQRPSLRDVAVLVGHGTVARLRRLAALPARAPRPDSPQWRAAAAVFVILGALLSAGWHSYAILRVISEWVHFPWGRQLRFPFEDAILGGVWLLTALASVSRRPRAAAVLAGVGLLGEAVHVVRTPDMDWGYAIFVARFTGVLLVAVAAVVARRTVLVRHWSLAAFACATAVVTAGGWNIFVAPFSPMSGYVNWVVVGGGAGILLALCWVLIVQPGEVRRRLLVFAAPVAVQLVIFEWLGNGTGAVLPAAELLVLVVAAALTGLAGLLAVRRWERLRELIVLGRRVESEQAGTGQTPTD